MPKQVQIVGDPETYEVLCETETTKILVNPRARARRDIALLEQQMAKLRADLVLVDREPVSDVRGNPITGP